LAWCGVPLAHKMKFTNSLKVRITQEMHARLMRIAEARYLKLSQLVRIAVAEYLKREEENGERFLRR